MRRPRGVEAAQEPPPVGQLLAVGVVEAHVGHAVAVGLERGVRRAEEAGLALVAPRHVLGGGGEADERRHRRIDRAFELRDDRAEARPAAHRPQGRGVAAGLHLHRVVPALRPDDRADEHELVGPRRDLREALADHDAGHVGLDRQELAAHLGRGVGLQVPEVLVRRAAPKKDVDDRLVAQASARPGGFGPDHVGEGEAGPPRVQAPISRSRGG
jgi:hypothetical protein